MGNTNNFKIAADIIVPSDEFVDASKLQPGDHIYVSRLGIYTHHGIFVVNNRVIHFIGTKGNSGSSDSNQCCGECGYNPTTHHGVVKTCVDCFLRGPIPKILRRRVSRYCLPPNRVVEMAEMLFDQGFGNYNLLFNNCENFANYCKTGISYSAQTLTKLSTGLPL